MKKAMQDQKNNQVQLDPWLNWQCRWLVWQYYKGRQIRDILANNQGMGIVEIALIIVVIVALAFLFKTKTKDLLTKIFDGINIGSLGEH
ncbi:hypothetical protein EII17_08445 [Clostridiales bacterium COT073_COT-073]|nr:hypothetical protein EII17_08445 [Clostridiales bacterium COT073_COT-073]